jgi:S-adenosylmethionine synthetase
MLAKIKKDIVSILIPRIIAKYPAHAHLFNDAIHIINPTGKFVMEDLMETQDLQEENHCDTYGGKGAHGGGAFSEKTQVKWIEVPLMLHVILLKLSCRWCC